MTNATLSSHRDLVIEQLSAAYAGEHLELEEMERRMSLAHGAQTAGELDHLVTDLVPAAAAGMALVPARRLRVLLGSVVQAGPRRAPSELAARVMWGNLVLDLREAELPPGGMTIDVHVTMGHLEVIVPPGVEVEVDASAVLGNVEEHTEPRTRLSLAPRVRITGRVTLGNLEVATLRAGETHRDARRRARSARRTQRAMRRFERRAMRCLPPPRW
jgi:hypothetical protein